MFFETVGSSYVKLPEAFGACTDSSTEQCAAQTTQHPWPKPRGKGSQWCHKAEHQKLGFVQLRRRLKAAERDVRTLREATGVQRPDVKHVQRPTYRKHESATMKQDLHNFQEEREAAGTEDEA
ncbi:hypothetical protein COCOBI_08-5560 [Coccomyxa sp. Obi]|nr:hypothetical protein COCOBI_08-5560 [Coccomyxa sp. Obi]